MIARLNLTVADDIPDKLTALAGGERKRGQFITDLVRAVYEGKDYTHEGMDVEALRLQVMGLAGEVRTLQGRLVQVERTVAALVAANAERE